MARHRLYNTAAWRRKREAQLRDEPLCRFCAAQDKVTAATIADHVEPHRGDEDAFWNNELQSLCHYHHNTAKQRQEVWGYDSITDLDGYPLDPNHPSNVDQAKRDAE